MSVTSSGKRVVSFLVFVVIGIGLLHNGSRLSGQIPEIAPVFQADPNTVANNFVAPDMDKNRASDYLLGRNTVYGGDQLLSFYLTLIPANFPTQYQAAQCPNSNQSYEPRFSQYEFVKCLDTPICGYSWTPI